VGHRVGFGEEKSDPRNVQPYGGCKPPTISRLQLNDQNKRLKVKFALEQTTKAEMGSTGIALLFL
jgi:hypothetical protein